MHRRQWITLTVAVAATGAVFAQGYPTKVVKLVVPFAPGGTTDIVARVIADPLGKAIGQTVIVENKAGGGGVIGANETAKATPDGYALGMATVSTTAANPAINPKIPYNPRHRLHAHHQRRGDAERDCRASRASRRATTRASLPSSRRTRASTPIRLRAPGGIGHLQTELFKNLAGVFITHIPYRGAGPALNDTVAGQVPIIFDNMPSALPFINTGKLIPIVVAAPQRLTQLPNVPTFKEVGLEPVNRMAYYGIYGPKGLPKEVVDKINSGVKKALEDPAVRKRIEDTGSLVVANTPDQFARPDQGRVRRLQEGGRAVEAQTRLSPEAACRPSSGRCRSHCVSVGAPVAFCLISLPHAP